MNMKPKIDDNDLNLFFKINKKEISDDGFSQKVSQKLPLSNNFYVATYTIWTIAVLLVIAVLFKFINFDEKFPFFLSYFGENITAAFVLFFKNPKIYITAFLALIAAGSYFIHIKRLA